MAALAAAEPCCEGPQALRYQTISQGFNERIVIDGSEQVLKLKTGKSWVEAYALPANRSGYAVVIESLIRNDEIFAPALLLLDGQFNVVDAVNPNQFIYLRAKGMSTDRLNYTLNITPELGAAYLLVFTSDDALSGSTEYVHPARAYAEAQSLSDPGVPNPKAKHSPVGLFELSVVGTFVTPADQQKDMVDRWVDSFWGDVPAATADRSTPATVEAIARSVPDSSSPVIASAAVVTTAAAVPAPVAAAASGAMMAETEAMYNQMITQAVAGRDIDKAMKLVEEAERAGSASARKTFVEEVKKLK
ncbi:MAG: hypothetical protein II007_03350 [Gammaproteobacteria bacterium]|nr:hypothetical protein [Gammaproteobacteria bacterium]